MNIGYIRVSSRSQNTARQEEALKDAGVDKFYIDTVSGKDTNRPELKKMMDFVREGDTVIFESIDRFARSTRDFLELTEQLEKKRVRYKSLKEGFIDTSTPQGELVTQIFAVLAEFERKLIAERRDEGIAIAKAEGRMGRPKKQPDDFQTVYNEVKAGKKSVSQVCRDLNISRSTWYRRKMEYENGGSATWIDDLDIEGGDDLFD